MPLINDNQRLAKNALFLYVRLIATVIINIYTVRIIWNVLGVENYGIYNIVAGIVLMFAFLNNGMVQASQRFISYELGRGDVKSIQKVFCISVTVHILIAIAIFILAESIGLWFLYEKLNIPFDRMNAALCVYQLTIFDFIVNVVSVPYKASIIAHEHMKTYGYFGIIEVILKLIIVYLLIVIPFDKLITYAILVLCVTILIRFLYTYYCRRHFIECKYKFENDRHLIKDMFSFAGWSFIGNMGFSIRNQGIDIILNLAFNVAVNAAKGIAMQIGVNIIGFAQSFQMAINPQITKRYAAGELESMMNLVIRGCKYSLMLMMFIVVPFYFETEYVLYLWIGNVAPYTIGFMRLTLIMILIESMVGPITTAIQATGRIRNFQIIISSIMILSIPLAWIWIKFVDDPYISMYIIILSTFVAFSARVVLLHNEFPFPYSIFFKMMCLRLLPSILISFFVSKYIYVYFPVNILGLILFCISSVILIAIIEYCIGLDRNERQLIKTFISHKNRQ